MLITTVLFDEIQHSKPGESLPFLHSGLVKTTVRLSSTFLN